MSTQIFKEFIRFAYSELQTPGWKERKESLCGVSQSMFDFNTLHEYQVYGIDEERKEKVVITIIFQGMMQDDYWFKGWFRHTYPGRIWMMGEPTNPTFLDDEFMLFMLALSYEELMDIIGIDMISLK